MTTVNTFQNAEPVPSVVNLSVVLFSWAPFCDTLARITEDCESENCRSHTRGAARWGKSSVLSGHADIPSPDAQVAVLQLHLTSLFVLLYQICVATGVCNSHITYPWKSLWVTQVWHKNYYLYKMFCIVVRNMVFFLHVRCWLILYAKISNVYIVLCTYYWIFSWIGLISWFNAPPPHPHPHSIQLLFNLTLLKVNSTYWYKLTQCCKIASIEACEPIHVRIQ